MKKKEAAFAFLTALSACQTVDDNSSQLNSANRTGIADIKCSMLQVKPGIVKIMNPKYTGYNSEPKYIETTIHKAIEEGLLIHNQNGIGTSEPDPVVCRDCNDLAKDGKVNAVNPAYRGGYNVSEPQYIPMAADEANKKGSSVYNSKYNGGRNWQPQFVKCTEFHKVLKKSK